jgi:plasmid segregation protein ParM
MKTTKNTIIIGIDHGYGNIKTAGTVTPTGITAYDTEPTFAGKILVYDGIYYHIGEGHKAFKSDKTTAFLDFCPVMNMTVCSCSTS